MAPDDWNIREHIFMKRRQNDTSEPSPLEAAVQRFVKIDHIESHHTEFLPSYNFENIRWRRDGPDRFEDLPGSVR